MFPLGVVLMVPGAIRQRDVRQALGCLFLSVLYAYVLSEGNPGDWTVIRAFNWSWCGHFSSMFLFVSTARVWLRGMESRRLSQFAAVVSTSLLVAHVLAGCIWIFRQAIGDGSY